MAVHRDVRVARPERTFVQGKGGTRYVYLYTEFFRNDEGRPRNRSVAIGALCGDDESMMWPNDNYMDIYGDPRPEEEAPPRESATVGVGYTAVVEECLRDLGLDEIMAGSFGEDLATRAKVICAHMCKGDSAVDYVDDFCEKEMFLGASARLDGRRASDLFKSVGREEMTDFYLQWVPLQASDGYVCYDVTSVSTWSDMIVEAEYGHDRDHEKLPQINMGLFHSEGTGYPVFAQRYNGSVNDHANVLQAIAAARACGLDANFKLVADGVFFQEEKVRAIVDAGVTITCGMPICLDVSKSYVDRHGQGLICADNYVGHDGTYAKVVEDQEIFGVRCRVLVGFCMESAMLLNDDLDAKVMRYESEDIPSIKRHATVTRHKKYTNLFDFEQTEDGRFTFCRNEAKIAAARKRFGYFTLFTTDPDATARELVGCYRDKDSVEKQFWEMKRGMDGRRPRVHSQQALDGKYGLLFICLIIRRWLRKRLEVYMGANNVPLKRCIMKLSDVKVYYDADEVRLEKAITKQQREMLEACGVDPKTLESRARETIVARGWSKGGTR